LHLHNNHRHHHHHQHNPLHQRHNNHIQNTADNHHLNASHLMSNELNKFFSNNNNNNNNHIDTRMHAANNLKSPFGRKSVSPHFFYSNKTSSNSSNNSSFIPFGSNLHANFSNGNHSNVNIPNFASLNQLPNNHHHQQQQQHQHNQHQHNLQTTSNYLHQNNFLPSFNSHESASLKIPTTPTRSKSLSPSLRDVIQHPRLRHKQQNKTGHADNELTNGNHGHHNHHSNQHQHVNKPAHSTSTDMNKEEKRVETREKCKATSKASSFEFIDKNKLDKREEEEENVPNNKSTLKRNENSAFEPIVAKSNPPNNCSVNKSQNKTNDTNAKAANEQAATTSESKKKAEIEEIGKQNTIVIIQLAF
jgi:hypothetical protein